MPAWVLAWSWGLPSLLPSVHASSGTVTVGALGQQSPGQSRMEGLKLQEIHNPFIPSIPPSAVPFDGFRAGGALDPDERLVPGSESSPAPQNSRSGQAETQDTLSEPGPAAASGGRAPPVLAGDPGSDPALQEFLRASGQRPLELGRHPALRPFLDRLKGMVQELVQEKDGPQGVHLILIDDISFGVELTTLPSGDRVLSINLGTIRFLESDDELAFLIGQALERGSSELAQRSQRTRESTKSPGAAIGGALLERAIDNEADVKSVLGRLIERGYDPHAAYGLLTRIIETLGDPVRLRGASLSSRRDAIALAITHWTRRLGKDPGSRFGDKPRRLESLGEVKSAFFNSRGFETAQWRAIAGLLRAPQSRARQGYQAIRAADVEPKDFYEFYVKDFERNWDELLRLGAGLFDERRAIDLQLRLHETLGASYAQARRALGADSFQAASLEQLKAFRYLEHRPCRLAAPELVTARMDLKEAEQDLRRRMSSLARISDPPRRKSLEAELEAARAKLERKRREWELARYPFIGDDIEARLDALLDLPESKRELYSRERMPDELAAQGFKFKRLSTFYEQVALRERKTIADNLPVMLSEDQPLESRRGDFGDSLGLYLKIRPEPQDLGELLEAYVRIVERALGRAAPGKPVQRVIQSLNPSHWKYRDHGISVWQLLGDYATVASAAAKLLWQRIVAAVAAAASSVQDLSLFINHLSSERKLPWSLKHDPGAASTLFLSLQRTLAAELSSADSVAAVFAVCDAYERSLQDLHGASSLAVLMTQEGERVLEAGAQALIAVLERSRNTEALRVARSALAIRYPRLSGLKEKTDAERRKSIKATLAALSLDPQLSRKLGRFLPYPAVIASLCGRYYTSDECLEDIANNPNSIDFESRDPHNGVARADSNSLLEWLGSHRPDELELAVKVSAHASESVFGRYLAQRFQSLLQSHAALGPSGSVSEAAYRFWRQVHEFPPQLPNRSSKFREAAMSAMPENAAEGLDFFNAYIEGVRRLAHEMAGQDSGDSKRAPDWGSWLDVTKVERLLTRGEAYPEIPPETLARAWINLTEVGKLEPAAEQAFESIWRLREADSAVAELLSDEALVGRLYFSENKKALALWQIDRRHGLAGMRQAGEGLGRDAMRPELHAIRRQILRQFPQPSVLRNELLNEVEKAVVSTQRESESFDELRLGLESWSQARGLEAVDLPHRLSRSMKTQEDRFELLRTLIGDGTTPPAFPSMGKLDPWLAEQLRAARRMFQEAQPSVQIYALQALLDENNGILSRQSSQEELLRLVLGPPREGPAIVNAFREKFFPSYLGALVPGERKAVLAAILAGRVGQKPGAGSLKGILEAMGPFGIKAGQFLRTSGLLPQEERAQLDNFLDRALEPSRAEIYQDLERVFAKTLAGIGSVGPLVGSGSLNYVVLARLTDPKTGESRQGVVRMLRRNAGQLVLNENAVWERVIETLQGDSDPAARRLAGLLEGARRHSYELLKPGGIELNLAIERQAYQQAVKAYESPPGPRRQPPFTELRIEAVRPLDDLQEGLVPKEFSERVSLYEYIPNVRFKNLPHDVRLRAARGIVEAELKALFEKGVFDPDGHPGNWLVDPERSRMVRVDYAQLQALSSEQRDSLRRVMASLLRPRADGGMARVLHSELRAVFSFSGVQPAEAALAAALKSALKSPDLPAADSPHERLLFLQDKLEDTLRAGGYPKLEIALQPPVRTAIACLAKLAYYQETLGRKRFGMILLKAVGFHPARYAGLELKNRALGLLRPGARR